MLNEFDQWEVILKNQDPFDIYTVVSELESKITGKDYSVPPINYEELDIFDSVSLSFDIPEDIFKPNTQNLIDAGTEAIKALQEVQADSDFLDISRVQLDNKGCDSIIIKATDPELDVAAPIDWSGVFADIERYAQDPFSYDIFNVVQDIAYQPSRTGITLIKGGGRAQSKNISGNVEHEHADSRNTRDSIEKHESFGPDESIVIPLKLYMENGELVFKANLSGVDLSDLTRMTHLANMRSVLSLTPRKVKTK